jgi:hypothetical protein
MRSIGVEPAITGRWGPCHGRLAAGVEVAPGDPPGDGGTAGLAVRSEEPGRDGAAVIAAFGDALPAIVATDGRVPTSG